MGFFHSLFLTVLLKILVKGQCGEATGKGSSNFGDRIEGSSYRMCEERPGSLHDSNAKLCRTIYKTLSRFLSELFDSGRYVSKQAYWISYDVQASKNFIELINAISFIMCGQLFSDAGGGIDAIVDLYSCHLYGGIYRRHDYSEC